MDMHTYDIREMANIFFVFWGLSHAQLTIFIETLESVSGSKPFDTMIVFLKECF